MDFESDARVVVQALQRYYQESISSTQPVLQQKKIDELIERLELGRFLGEEKRLTGEVLEQFVTHYLQETTRLHHPAYMAHQVSAPHYAGSLAALIDGFTNNAMAIYEMGPAASAIEFFVIQWLTAKIWSLPTEASESKEEPGPGGVLTHGGSLANLTALIAARSRLDESIWPKGQQGDLALLAPASCHYSIARAAGIMGIGTDAIITLPVDQHEVVIPERLPEVLRQAQDAHKRIIALAANACSTAVGLYDPIQEIGSFCREQGIWFHVDGAHGAAAILSDKLKHHLRGLELADSLVIDAHKMLRTPTLCAAVLVRDQATLDCAFVQDASYLFHEKEQPGVDFLHRTVECTKAGLGLRLFFVLAALGESNLAQTIEQEVALAQAAYQYIHNQPGFACACQPQSNILCFRVDGDDETQLWLRNQLIGRGTFYLSSAMFRQKRYLRLALMNPQTSFETIRSLVEEIRKIMHNS